MLSGLFLALLALFAVQGKLVGYEDHIRGNAVVAMAFSVPLLSALLPRLVCAFAGGCDREVMKLLCIIAYFAMVSMGLPVFLESLQPVYFSFAMGMVGAIYGLALLLVLGLGATLILSSLMERLTGS